MFQGRNNLETFYLYVIMQIGANVAYICDLVDVESWSRHQEDVP